MTEAVDVSTKLFEFVGYPKRVPSPDSGRKLWRLRVYRKDFPENAYPTSNGSVTVPDSDDVFYDFKQLSKDNTVPAEYYVCSFTVNDTCAEFTSMTETGLRLGFFEYLKSQFKNLRTTLVRQWTFKGFEDPQTDSDSVPGVGLFDGDEDW
jgi:hypothetical protein